MTSPLLDSQASRPPPPRRSHYLAVAAALGLFVVYGSFLPWRFETIGLSEGFSMFLEQFTAAKVKASRSDFGTNVLLFVPLSFAAMGALLVDRDGRLRTIIALVVVGLSCLLLSLAVEFGQVWLPSRTASRIDVIAQILGTIVGLGMWLAFGNRLSHWLRAWTGENQPANRVGLFLWIYLAGLCLYNVLPLDLTVHPMEIARQFTRGRILLIPFTACEWNLQTMWALLFDALIFVPVGVMCTGRWTSGRFRSTFDAILVGTLIVIGIECAQLFVLSRFSDTTDVITGTAGVCGGVWLGRRWASGAEHQAANGSLRWLGLALLCTVFACAYLWLPLETIDDTKLIRERLQGFLHLPFGRLHRESDFLAASEMLRKFLLFVPIGGSLALAILTCPVKRRVQLILAGIGICLLVGLALLVEIAQAAIPRHTPDITDSVLYTLGASTGLVAVWWIRWRRSAGTGKR